jgi:hypothetical protein
MSPTPSSWHLPSVPIPTSRRTLHLSVRNLGSELRQIRVTLSDLSNAWQVAGVPELPVALAPAEIVTFDLSIMIVFEELETARMTLEVTGDTDPVRIPVAFVAKASVGPDDLALAAKGATVKADSEYERETACAAKAIDGVIATPEDFSNRWHSSLATPHPHWIEVELPKPERIGRVVIRFADPAGHPVEFRGFVRTRDSGEWREVFCCNDNKDNRTFRSAITPVVTNAFRLVISRSVNPVSQNAAQISEIELYPALDE